MNIFCFQEITGSETASASGVKFAGGAYIISVSKVYYISDQRNKDLNFKSRQFSAFACTKTFELILFSCLASIVWSMFVCYAAIHRDLMLQVFSESSHLE